jgi:16S rRNA (cytidine1402-2'-O)-methyltransferase
MRVMPRGTLFVVATPIGHLEDITLRAIRVLKSVALVAAEDTRRTGKLLQHYAIRTPVLSVHQHNERARVGRILSHLDKGDSVALVTDAGTPGVSDPGATLVAMVRGAGIRVEPIPGPSAVLAALSVAGVSSPEFVFMGFPPLRSKDRKKWLADLVSFTTERAAVVFEAPHRIRRTLEDLSKLVNQPILLARELTKIHEEIRIGTAEELLKTQLKPVGEYTLVIQHSSAALDRHQEKAEDRLIEVELGCMPESGRPHTKRQVARVVAARLGLTTRQVYAALERLKLG